MATDSPDPSPRSPEGEPTDQPSDNTTLVEVLRGYADGGYASTFWAEDQGVVRCSSCNSTLQPARLQMKSLRRLEGASDPADMVAVVALGCPVCSTLGTMVLGFGPNASEADSKVLGCLQDRRLDDNGIPASSFSSETGIDPSAGVDK